MTTITTRPLSRQCQLIHRLLVERGSLSAREAYEAGCGMRLAARIAELREAYGTDAITTESETHAGGNHARYHWRGTGEVQQELFSRPPVSASVRCATATPHSGANQP